MLLAGVRAGGDGRHALVDLGGGVRHHPDDGDPVGSRASIEAVSTPAARETTRVPGFSESRDLVQQIAHVLGLDHQDHRVGLGHGLVVLEPW